MIEPPLEMIARLQAQPESATAYSGGDCVDIEGALNDLDQPWRDTMRTVTVHGRVVAAAAIEWDEEVDTGWVYGPWLDCPPAAAVDLLSDLIDQTPVSRHEIFADVANTGVAELARLCGWYTGDVNHSYTRSGHSGAERLTVGPIRPANPGDHDSINRLHASEFPRTYATTAQLLADYDTLVYDDVDAGVSGYASGQIQDDGTGYVDFLAVDPHARGKGIGAGLLAGLLARLHCSHFALTVAEENSTARRLFEEQGWRHEASFRAYRSQP